MEESHMAKAAKKAAKKSLTRAVKNVVGAAARAAGKVAAKVRRPRRTKPSTALDRQAENLGRMAGRAVAVIDKVRAEGVATAAGLRSAQKSTGKKTSARKKGAKG
jgi:hypothetical protein